jgi:hypothetical protein
MAVHLPKQWLKGIMMKFTQPKLVVSGAFNDTSVEFMLDDKKVEIHFEWSSNDGDGWSFDLLLNHPDIYWSITTKYYRDSCITILLSDLSGSDDVKHGADNVADIPQHIINELGVLINAIIKTYHKNHPTCSAKDNYFGT